MSLPWSSPDRLLKFRPRWQETTTPCANCSSRSRIAAPALAELEILIIEGNSKSAEIVHQKRYTVPMSLAGPGGIADVDYHYHHTTSRTPSQASQQHRPQMSRRGWGWRRSVRQAHHSARATTSRCERPRRRAAPLLLHIELPLDRRSRRQYPQHRVSRPSEKGSAETPSNRSRASAYQPAPERQR
jgi:hypothetical protein